MAFIYDLTDTWNNAGTSFNGIKLNATDTASAAGSKLLDLQINGASKLAVGKTGTVTATGIIESTVGGFKFPDATTQTTKATVNSVSGTGSVNGITLTGSVTNSGSLTLGGTLGNIANNQLSNSAITINGTSTALGGSIAVGTVTSVGGTGTVSGLSLTGSVTTSGSLTLGGTLVLTSGQVTDGLGYTPYNATNPTGYITAAALTPYLTSATAATTYQPLDGDLTAIAALAGTPGLIRKTAANTYALDTAVYITGITSGDVTTALGFTPYNATNPSGYLSSVSLTTNVTGTLPIANGGTGATTDSGARTALGLGTAAVLNSGVANGVATLDGSGTVPTSQLPGAVLGGLNYQGTWNASTNVPTLASSVGSKGYYYVVSTAGSTNLNGITDWKIGDWAVYDGSTWQKVDNTDAVSSVNGFTGAVVLTTTDVAQGTNLYFTQAAARGSVSAGTGISYNSTSGVITNSAPDQTVALTGAGTTVVTGTYPNFTITSNDSIVGTVTSVAASGGTTGLSFTGSPITTAGTLTLGGTLALANGGTGASTASGARTALELGTAATTDASAYATAAQGAKADTAVQTIASADGSVTITGTTAIDLSVPVTAATNSVLLPVRNTTGATLTKGTAVYISGATGQISTVSKALATSDATSAQTLGLITANLANNTNGNVTLIGTITNIDTSAYTDGQQLYLSPTTAGTLTATKPYAPQHLVYMAVVEHAHPSQGKLFVKVQNGYEMDELHNVSAQSPANNDGLFYNTTTSLWEKKSIATALGYTPYNATNPAGYTTNTGTVTSVGGTGTVSGLTLTGTVTTSGNLTLGGTLAVTPSNFASQTANTVLAAPNGAAGVPTFRAIVAADVPTLNQNTTGTASNVTGTVAVANGGTGATTLTSGYLVKGNGTSAASASVVYDTGTNVGIGDAAPAYKLTVAGDLRLTGGGDVRLSSATGTTTFGGDSQIYNDANNMIFTTGTTTAERMRITSAGFVGIGTASPAYNLEVVGSGNVATLIRTTGGGVPIIRLSSDGVGEQVISANVGSVQNMTFTVASSERMRITSAGDVGIGTTAPGAKLDVAGGDIFVRTSGRVLTDTVETYTGGATPLTLKAANTIALTTASTERMRIDTSGNVGIGTSSPTVKLEVSGSFTTTADVSGVTTLGRFSAGFPYVIVRPDAAATGIEFRSNAGAAQLNIIQATGNVGIGTSSPGAKLTVNDTNNIPVRMGDIAAAPVSQTAVYVGVSTSALSGGNGDLVLIPRTSDARSVLFYTGNGTAAERMRIDSSGNVGIGTASPQSRLNVEGGSLASGAATGILAAGSIATGRLISGGGSTVNAIHTYYDDRAYEISAGSTSGYVTGVVIAARSYTGTAGDAVSFWTRNTERARIDSSGNLLVGTTATINAAKSVISFTSANNGLYLDETSNTSGTEYIRFNQSGTATGSITRVGTTSAVAYNTTSDARAKHDIVDAPDASSLIDAIQVRSFKWNADNSEQRYGFIAQELVEVAPEAVSQPTDPDDMMGVDYSKLVPILIKEVQSLRARVAQLEGN